MLAGKSDTEITEEVFKVFVELIQEVDRLELELVEGGSKYDVPFYPPLVPSYPVEIPAFLESS